MRCKVVCNNIYPVGRSPEDGYYLTFSPVYSGSHENEQFFKWTPGGTIQFNVMNLSAVSNFELGKEYYVDFSPTT